MSATSLQPSEQHHATNTDPYPEDPLNPPKLDYSLHTRKKQIARFWTLLLLDCCIIPVAVFYPLRFATPLSDSTVFGITTALIGGTLVFEFFSRGWHLWKKKSNCRVKDAPRGYFDWSHWVFGIALLVAVVELVVGNSMPDPIMRLLATPVSSVVLVFTADVLMQDIFYLAGLKTPVRISSIPKGAHFRPGIYSIIEDFVATDGSGEQKFRERLDVRYTSSYMFRRMLCVISLFWSLAGLVVSLGTSAMVWTLPREIAFGLGWVLPFIWGILWTMITIPWVQKYLAREQASWVQARTCSVV